MRKTVEHKSVWYWKCHFSLFGPVCQTAISQNGSSTPPILSQNWCWSFATTQCLHSCKFTLVDKSFSQLSLPGCCLLCSCKTPSSNGNFTHVTIEHEWCWNSSWLWRWLWRIAQCRMKLLLWPLVVWISHCPLHHKTFFVKWRMLEHQQEMTAVEWKLQLGVKLRLLLVA